MTKAQKIESRAINPYSSAGNMPAAADVSGGVLVEAQRATTEIMTAFEVAKRFPRNSELAAEKILKECSRPTLAELSTYEYAKGGQTITGPTIRLLEAISRAWGNIRFGWQVLESTKQESSIRAYAVDLEDNIMRETTFAVRHWRDLKKTDKNPNGGYAITDERDIYELQANMAMRRVRSCLEGLIPRDIIDMALEQCDMTSKTSVDASPDALKKMLEAFKKFGVNQEMIEAKFQGLKFDKLKPVQIVALRKNYAAIKDGLAKVEDFFDTSLADKPAAPEENKETKGQPDLKKAVEEKQKESSKSEEKPEPKPQAEEVSVFDLEQQIRKAIKDAKDYNDAYEKVNEYAEELARIDREKPAAGKSLRTWIDATMAEKEGAPK